MPLLARMITAPLLVDVRRGALSDLGDVLADQRISSAGRVAVALSPSSGKPIAAGLRDHLVNADFYAVGGGTVDAALRLVDEVRTSSYDAIVGIGGGRVLDATKYAAARLGLPMVAVATNLAHDGIASPVSTLDNDAGRGSYGVPAPLAVLVDLDLVRRAPVRSVRAGIGEALSNLSALRDWQMAHETMGEAVDGLAIVLARCAGEAVLHHPGTVDDDAFLTTLAESLVLSGLSMVVAGTTRPSSGACHEISHAIDLLHPDRASYHGEQVGAGAAFATWLRGEKGPFDQIVTALRRHELPVLPAELGFDTEEFTRIVSFAPSTRPGRHTILEERALSDDEIREAVEEYVGALG
ncbi:MAG: iron-containing alcohol dehydrogenase family protein [Actinomycetota bacterium]|nr:iron-containing alcohol dehydrogenase family protein [Actinomycetota bacterium]